MLKSRFFLRHAVRSFNYRHPFTPASVRYLSSQKDSTSFGDVLKKVKGAYNEQGEKVTKEETETDETKASDKESVDAETEAEKKEGPSIDYKEFAFNSINSGRTLMSSFVTGIKETWVEMLEGNKESKVRKAVPHAQVYQAKAAKAEGDEDEAEEKPAYEGTTAIMVGENQKSTWEKMSERLENSPLIREMLRNSRKFSKQAASTDVGQQAKKIGDNVSDKIHDAREFWETSQNPLVYKISGAWESLTAPTEEGVAISEIQKLDPTFIKEAWAEEVTRDIVPTVIKAHLEGNLKALKPYLGEAVYNKLAADIRTRKNDGVTIDTNILDLFEAQSIIRHLDHEGAIILQIYMVQQIHCVRNRAGEIIEGGESEVVAKFYSIAFKQVFDDETGFCDWKVIDYELSGGDAYY